MRCSGRFAWLYGYLFAYARFRVYMGKIRSRHDRRSIQHIPVTFRDKEIFKKIRTKSSDFFTHPVTDFRDKNPEVGGVSNCFRIFLKFEKSFIILHNKHQ
jgi:hypothetical protein